MSRVEHEQIKNIRKVARDLGEVFTDEQLEAMINECESSYFASVVNFLYYKFGVQLSSSASLFTWTLDI